MVYRLAILALIPVYLQFAQDTSVNSPQSFPTASPSATTDTPESPTPVTCPAGGPLGPVKLEVKSPKGDQPLPFRGIIHLSEGDTVFYSPILRIGEKRPGEVALVMVPAKHAMGKELLSVTDPKSADKAQTWQVPETMSLAALVYGPSGLSKKKVRGFLSQDEVLIAQLADYAEKTSQTEALLQALSNSGSSSASMNAALSGFASQYGLGVQIDKTAPPSAQAQTLFATMNPQLATYDPIAPSAASRVGQTASMATAAATLFFGSPVGLAAGGTAMLLDLRAIAFPGTEFRSSFAQKLPQSGGENLCGPRGPVAAHTRVAYIWAVRIPNAPTPALKMGNANFLPAGEKSPVPVEVSDPGWKYLERARKWTLEDGQHHRTDVTVTKLANQRSLEIDLGKSKLGPGDYHLSAYWDWSRFEAGGDIHIRPLSDFEQAKLEARSQDKLLEKAGKVAATLGGSDFEFTTKVEMKKVGDEFATAEPVRFLLPTGLREGPQPHMDVQIDTANLDPGDYSLLISQQDGKNHPVRFKILPNAPKVDNLPILANQGLSEQHYVLKGERLDELTRLEAPGVSLQLGPAAAGERSVTVELKSNAAPGTELPVKAYLQNRSEPLTWNDALQVTGPLPVVASSKLSLPAGFGGVALKAGEFPAGYTLTAMLDAKNIGRDSVLRLGCDGDVSPRATLHVGSQTDRNSLQQLSPDQLFLSFDTSGLPAGCSLRTTIDNGSGGKSQPYVLSHIVRLPFIESFNLVTGQSRVDASGVQSSTHSYTLTGSNLEMIGKLAWDQTSGVPVTQLPAAIQGGGQKQSLSVELPDPPGAHSPLFVWLRGEEKGRSTNIFSAGGATQKSQPSATAGP